MSHNRGVKVAAACLFGIALMVYCVAQRPDTADDFRSFYRGGALSQAHESVYSHPFAFPDKHADVKFLPFVRLPSYAAALRTLAALPYGTARKVWIGLSALSFLAIIFLFPAPRQSIILAMSFSFPIAYAFVLGQDIGFILMLALLSARLFAGGREFVAGLAASLIAIKFSYLPAVGLVFLAKSRKGTVGMVIGVALQLAVSFALAGAGWPGELAAILRSPMFDVEPRRMPNIGAVTAGLSIPHFVVALATLAGIAAMWFLCRKLHFDDALMVSLAIMLILLPHCYVYDPVVLIPLFARVASMDSWQGILAMVGLSPIPYLLLLSEVPALLLAGSAGIVVITCFSVAKLYRLRMEEAQESSALAPEIRNALLQN